MPRLDQTGPMGKGKKTGRGFGKCIPSDSTEIPQMLPPTEKTNQTIYGLGRGGIPCGKRMHRGMNRPF